MAKRFGMAIVMALLVAAMSFSMVAAGGGGVDSNDPAGMGTWAG